MHGEIIKLESAGEGLATKAEVRLPVFSSENAASALISSPRMNVLLIEDNDDAREMSAAMLEIYDYTVLKAANGTDGQNLAATHLPNAAVIDIGLLDVDGYEIAKRLRANVATKGMQLIALTGYAAPEDVARAMAAGFDIHMTKPPNFDKLRAAFSAFHT